MTRKDRYVKRRTPNAAQAKRKIRKPVIKAGSDEVQHKKVVRRTPGRPGLAKSKDTGSSKAGSRPANDKKKGVA